MFWTELISDDQVQIIVPNGGVWGQPLRNYSVYPAPPHIGELRLRLSEDTEIEPAVEKVRSVVETQPRVLREPPPTILLDRGAAEDTLEMVVSFAVQDDEVAVVKSDLIKAARATLSDRP